MSLITYENKVAINEQPTIPDVNKVKASDMNEIKSVVNGNYNELKRTVYKTKITQDTSQIIIDNLDMIRDGGEYEIDLFAVTSTSNTDIKLTFENEEVNGYYFNAVAWVNTLTATGDLSPFSGYRKNVDSIYYSLCGSTYKDYPSHIKIKLFFINDNHVGYDVEGNISVDGTQKSVIIKGVQSHAINNITKIKFSNVTFRDGTSIIVRKNN